MHFGLTQLIPPVIYGLSLIVIILTLFWDPKIGIFFLFPLLPYQNIFEKIQTFPLGKDLNDLLILAIIIGWLLKRNKINNSSEKDNSIMICPILFLIIINSIGMIISSVNRGLSINFNNVYFLDWKNYIFLPIICLLTFKNLTNYKTLKMFTFFLIVGILGVSYSYFRASEGINFSHFSYDMRNKMTGLFVYLGPNHYGAFYAHFVFVIMGIFLFEKSTVRKIIFLIIIIVTLYSLTITFSRGAYLAVIAGFLFLGVVKEKKLLFLLIIFIIFWKSFVPYAVVERIEMTRDGTGQLEDSANERVKLWEIALNMFRSSPIIGNGFNSFQALGFTDTHNYYLKMLAELGIIGLINFLYLCFAAFWISWKLYLKSNNNFFRGLGLGFATCVISVMITNYFGNRWSYLSLGSYFWIFLGIIMRAYLIDKAQIEKIKG
ncbi:MAG: O-antigen ligase family protein [Nanoarchaeota archaeon]